MSVVIGFLIIYLSIICGAMFYSCIFNKKIELTIAVNIGIIILLLYVFGLFNMLLQGVYIISSINIILGIVAIIIKKKKIVELVCTPGLAFFSIVYIVLMGTSFNKNLVEYDQFFYRSLNVKMMFNTNSMFQEYERLYQPVSTLIEYYFMRLIGVYKQGVEAFAMQILGISLLLPMYENVKKSNFAKIAIGLIIVCVPTIFTNLVFYESSYPDATLGLILAYILYIYFYDDSFIFKIFIGIIMSAIMVLTKPTGIALMLIIVAMLCVYEVLKNKYYKKENIKKIFKNKNFVIIFIIIVSIVLSFLSWKYAVKIGKEEINTNNVAQAGTTQPTDQVSTSSLEHLIKAYTTTVFGKYEENNGAAYSNEKFLPALYKTIPGFSVPVKLSFVATSIVIIMAYVFYYYKEKDKKFKNVSITVVIGFILYMLFLQMYYTVGNRGDNFVEHWGLDRYAPPFLLAMISVLLFIIFKNLSVKEYKAKPYIIVLLAIIFVTPLNSISNVTVTSGIANIISQEQINLVKNRTDKIHKMIEEKAPIITITQNGKEELHNLMMKYYFYPEHKTYKLEYVSNKNQIQSLINKKEYKYIYVYCTNNKLQEIFGEIFINNIELKDETLYEIIYNEDDTVEIIEKAYIDSYIEENN